MWNADAIVFAVGIPAMQGIVRSSPALAETPEFAKLSNLGSIDCLAARLWLDKRVSMDTPSNVLVGFDKWGHTRVQGCRD